MQLVGSGGAHNADLSSRPFAILCAVGVRKHVETLKIIRSDRQLGKTVFSANEPGLYSAAQDDNFVHIAVNLANADLSNINRSIFTSTATVSRGVARGSIGNCGSTCCCPPLFCSESNGSPTSGELPYE